MDPNFYIQEKDNEPRKSLNQIQDYPSKSTSVIPKKTSLSRLLKNSDSNTKKLSKPNLNEVLTKALRSTSKKHLVAKTPEPKKQKNSKLKSEAKKLKQFKLNKKLPNENSPKRKQSKQSRNLIEVPQYMKENSLLLKDSKNKKSKKSLDGLKYDQRLKKAEIKQYVTDLNKITREENLKKFKHEKFKPKCPWGLDERRAVLVSANKNHRDSEAPKKKPHLKDRSKSAEKSKLEPKFPDEEFSIKKILKKPKLELKKPKLNLKKPSNPEKSNKSPNRNTNSKLSSKKTPKIFETSYEEPQNIWDDSEINANRSKTPENPPKKSVNFTYKSTGLEPYAFQKSDSSENSSLLITNCPESYLHKIEDTVQPTSATLKHTEEKDSFSIIPENKLQDTSNLDISKRKEEIKKKLNDLREKVENISLKQSVDEDDKINALIKIQAAVRGWLTRIALEKYLNFLQETQSWESFRPALSEEEESVNQVSVRRANGKVDVEVVMRTEVEWRDLQREKLELLKEKDFEDMKKIAKRMGKQDELIEYFREIIERRYENIDQIFDEHVEAIRSAVGFEGDEQESIADSLNVLITVNKPKPDPELIIPPEPTSKIDIQTLVFYSENEEQSLRISEIDQNSVEPASSLTSLSNRTFDILTHNSFELIHNRVQFLPSLSPSTLSITSEPQPPLFASDIVDSVEFGILHELFCETVDKVWESIIYSDQFIGDIVGTVFQELLKDGLAIAEDWIKLNTSQLFQPDKGSSMKDHFWINEKFIHEYLSSLFEFLNKTQFDLVSALEIPSSLPPLEMLNKMQESDIGVLIVKKNFAPVIPSYIYKNFAISMNSTKSVCQRLLFDTVNELLCTKYLKQCPMPWNPESSQLSRKPQNIPLLPALESELSSLNRLKSGKLPIIDLLLSSQDCEEDILSQMREDHLSCILAIEIISQEPEWLNYDFEESQVKLDLSDMTLEDLVEETITILNLI